MNTQSDGHAVTTAQPGAASSASDPALETASVARTPEQQAVLDLAELHSRRLIKQSERQRRDDEYARLRDLAPKVEGAHGPSRTPISRTDGNGR